MGIAKRHILWVDCIGGLVAGLLLFVFSQKIADWDSLSVNVIRANAIVNLLYGSFSMYVTTRRPRPIRLVNQLAVANMAWLAVCVVIVVWNWRAISGFGVFHILGEGVYVSMLGYIEWSWRRWLSDV